MTIYDTPQAIYDNAINRVAWVHTFTDHKSYVKQLAQFKNLDYFVDDKTDSFSLNNTMIKLDDDGVTILAAIKH